MNRMNAAKKSSSAIIAKAQKMERLRRRRKLKREKAEGITDGGIFGDGGFSEAKISSVDVIQTEEKKANQTDDAKYEEQKHSAIEVQKPEKRHSFNGFSAKGPTAVSLPRAKTTYLFFEHFFF